MDAVDETVLHSSLVCLIITSSSEQSLHPSLTEARGSHLIQGFLRLQTPDQVALLLLCWFVALSRLKLTAAFFFFFSWLLFIGAKSGNVAMSDSQKKAYIRGNLPDVRRGSSGEGDGGIHTPRLGGAVGARCSR